MRRTLPALVVPPLVVLAVVGLAAGCRASWDRPAAPAATVGVLPGHVLPGPGVPAGPGARAAFFQGLSDVEGPLAELRARATPPGVPPTLVNLADVEASVRRRFPRGTPNGALREVVAVGVCAASPLPPSRMADLVADPELERRGFGATTFRPVGVRHDVPGSTRGLYVVELLDVGEGPVRFDFRFAIAHERLDLADGTVLMRYDPAAWSSTEHVTLFRGVATIEPYGHGSLVTEMLICGSDVRVPFFLRGKLREMTYNQLQRRLDRLWEAAR